MTAFYKALTRSEAWVHHPLNWHPLESCEHPLEADSITSTNDGPRSDIEPCFDAVDFVGRQNDRQWTGPSSCVDRRRHKGRHFREVTLIVERILLCAYSVIIDP
jgi:hypothetical protein